MKKVLKRIFTAILTWEAKRVLERKQPRVVAITGSVGKTTAKDSIAAALSTTFEVRKSPKSYNSEIGIPLTILGLSNPWSSPLKWSYTLIAGFFVQFQKRYPSWLVLEVGADHPGDIQSLSRWLRSDFAVFTQFAEIPVHIEFFESAQSILREKLSLLQTLKPQGKIVVNADDASLLPKIQAADRNTPIRTYGLMPPADVINSNIEILYDEKQRPLGIEFDIKTAETDSAVKLIGVLGQQHVYATLCALTVALEVDIDIEKAITAVSSTPRALGRMNILAGIKHTTLIDDTYNSSPAAAQAALRVLNSLTVSGRKIAVLGDMLELGEHAETEHKKLGKNAARLSDVLIAVGSYAHSIAEGALHAGMPEKQVIQTVDAREAGKIVQERSHEGDVILLKGSQGTRMERAVLELLAEPTHGSELLVRQEKAWRNR